MFVLPTATSKVLGQGKLSMGPSVVALRQPGNWTIGALVNNAWSVAGSGGRTAVNQMTLQYFINYNLKKGWYLSFLEDDGTERGLAFIFVGSRLDRQFEFVQSEWVNDSRFFGLGGESDPITGLQSGTGSFTIPKQPIRRRLQGIPQFVVTRGGEYFFGPGLRGLRWLAELDN